MTSTDEGRQDITFEEFREEWLKEFREGDLSPFEKGQRFAVKLVTQWLGVTDDDEDLVICDGAGDGGIDIAYLHRADIDDDNQEGQAIEGDTWYLVQSKYGTAFQGHGTIIEEGRKIIATLAGENTSLSEHVNQLLERLNTFRQQASDRDRITFVFATDRPMTESDRQALAISVQSEASDSLTYSTLRMYHCKRFGRPGIQLSRRVSLCPLAVILSTPILDCGSVRFR